MEPDSMADTYNKETHQWTIEPPDSTSPVTQSINTFVDDVNLFIRKQPDTTEEQFLYQAQQDIHRWHGILRTTGGKLNTKKCFWSDFHLEYDKKGNPTIHQQTTDNCQLHLLNLMVPKAHFVAHPVWKASDILACISAWMVIKKDKEQMLIKCCQLFQKVYHQCPLTRQEVKVTYKTIFLPTITYPLPATTLSKKILNQAQSMTTPTILSKMGYNQNMPKAVIYTPKSHRGIGLKNLHTEQGIQQVLQLINYLCNHTHLGSLLTITLKSTR